MELETFTVSLKVDTSMPAVEILGSETKLPLVFLQSLYVLGTIIWWYHNLITFVASTIEFADPSICGSIGGGGGGRGRGVGAGGGVGR